MEKLKTIGKVQTKLHDPAIGALAEVGGTIKSVNPSNTMAAYEIVLEEYPEKTYLISYAAASILVESLQ